MKSTSPVFTILLALFFVALIANWWRRWALRAFGNENLLARKPTRLRWLLRPSNMLLILGFVLPVYSAFQYPPFGARGVRYLAAIIFCLAFVSRNSENQVLVVDDPSAKVKKRSDDFPPLDGPIR